MEFHLFLFFFFVLKDYSKCYRFVFGFYLFVFLLNLHFHNKLVYKICSI